MTRLGVSTKRVDIGTHVMDGATLSLPPIVLGTYGTDPKKKTLLVYGNSCFFFNLSSSYALPGHYDVQPALKEDGWDTDPFTLVEKDGRLCGRGASDDKGPVLAWLWVIEAHQKLGLDLPVNIKMCFEGMEENGSECLDDVIKAEAQGYFKGVDCVCISDNCTPGYFVWY
jgi:Cys-Gly metallodipeptidase DUG1